MVLIGDFRPEYVAEFNIHQNGIQIIESKDAVEIYGDPFRTVPLFITRRASDKELIVFSQFQSYYSLEGVDRTIDVVGFWAILLFGSGLSTRTLYKHVEQMPGAARIVVDKHRNEYTIERYWDYNVMVDDSIKNIDQAALGLYERLDKIFAAIDRGGSYIMGLSGGIDSRITLGFLSKYLSKDQLEVFTYGYDARILEHTYAKSIAEALSFNRPEFHKLSARSYMMARDYMVERSGGQLSMDHCHMLDFFLSKSESLSGKTQISNYFTDAIFGWDCEIPKKRDTIEGANLFTVLRNSVIREKDLVDEIAGDVRSVLDKYNPM